MLAKLTQARYRTIIHPAALLRPKKNHVAASKVSQSVRISTNAIPIQWQWKKRMLQPKFNASWAANSRKAAFLGAESGRLQTSHAAIAISVYSTVQTGPKIQFGGLKLGLASPAYQPGIAGAVKTVETPATR